MLKRFLPSRSLYRPSTSNVFHTWWKRKQVRSLKWLILGLSKYRAHTTAVEQSPLKLLYNFKVLEGSEFYSLTINYKIVSGVLAILFWTTFLFWGFVPCLLPDIKIGVCCHLGSCSWRIKSGAWVGRGCRAFKLPRPTTFLTCPWACLQGTVATTSFPASCPWHPSQRNPLTFLGTRAPELPGTFYFTVLSVPLSLNDGSLGDHVHLLPRWPGIDAPPREATCSRRPPPLAAAHMVSGPLALR